MQLFKKTVYKIHVYKWNGMYRIRFACLPNQITMIQLIHYFFIKPLAQMDRFNYRCWKPNFNVSENSQNKGIFQRSYVFFFFFLIWCLPHMTHQKLKVKMSLYQWKSALINLHAMVTNMHTLDVRHSLHDHSEGGHSGKWFMLINEI